MAPHPKQPPSQPRDQHPGTPTPCPHPHSQPLSFSLHVHHHSRVFPFALVITACVVGLVMFLCSVSVIMKIYHSRRHNRNRNRTGSPILFDVNEDPSISDDNDDGNAMHHIWFIHTVGLQQSFIDSITVFKYAKEQGVVDGTECSVCLGEFQEGESLRLLPKCSHAFHIPCIDTWLTSHKNCPLCRAPVAHEHVVGPTDHNNHHNYTDENVSHIPNPDDSGGSERTAPRTEFEGDVSSSSEIEDKVEEETQILRRTVSVDSSSASVMLRNVVLDFNSDTHSSDTHFGKKVDSSSSNDLRSSSSNVCKVASMGRASQKKTVSMRSSFSHSRKFLFSRHCRSQSSSLPL